MADTINTEEILLSEFETLPHEKIEIIEEKGETISDEVGEDAKTSVYLDLQPADTSTSTVIIESEDVMESQIICLQADDVRCITNLFEVRNHHPGFIGKPLRTYSSKNVPHVPITTSTIQIQQIKSEEISVPSPDIKIYPITIESTIPVQKKSGVRTYGKTRAKPDDGDSSNAVKSLPKKTGRSEPLGSPRKKRRLLLDNFKVIPNAEFKQQLQNTSDIVQKKSDIAPPTKKAMHFLTYGGVGKFFAYPGRKILSVPLAKLFFSHLTVTTEIRSVQMVDGQVAPLDPELRTPPSGTSKYEGMIVSYIGPHLYNDSLAKRAANSFDHLIKGMNVSRTKKSIEDGRKIRELRKGPVEPVQTTESISLVQDDSVVTTVLSAEPIQTDEIKIEDEQLQINSVQGIIESEIVLNKVIVTDRTDVENSTSVVCSEVNTPIISTDFVAIDDGDSLEVKEEIESKEEIVEAPLPETVQDTFVYGEASNTPVIFTIGDAKTEENFPADGTENIFFCTNNEAPEQEASQSNLEMLLAAAEQHHGSMEIADNIEITSEVLQDIEVDDPDGETKNGIVYCTAESDADGGLVIIDSSGRRYTVSSNPTGLTLWPEST